MDFQFIPNSDGSFDEGMRQTNPETGVEYIFSDGGWRPLGPKIEDQFDELDERYLKKDEAVGGVPVGSIMMWINSVAPSGWLKLKGGTFDINQYPLLHSYLQISVGSGYTSGNLPDWRGHYPAQLGDHLNGDVGIKLPQKTAMPSGGAPYHPNSIPNGNTRTFNGGGGTNAYSDGVARPAITEGWDDVTRPKTVAVHFIIKHD